MRATDGLRQNLDRRPPGRKFPNLIDFHVGDGDAAEGPVAGAPLAPVVGLAMDHDQATGVIALAQRAQAVFLARIGDMQGFAIIAPVDPPIDVVTPFRRAAVALPLFARNQHVIRDRP